VTDPDRDLERELDAALDQLVAAARSRVSLPPASEVRMLANRRRRHRIAAFGTTTTLALGVLGGGAFALSSSTVSTTHGEHAGSTTTRPSSQISGTQAPHRPAAPSPTVPTGVVPRTGAHRPQVRVPDAPSAAASGSSSAGAATIRIGPGSLIGVVDLPTPSSPALSWLRLPTLDRTASACDLAALRLRSPARTASTGFALEGRTTIVEELAEYRDARTARQWYQESVRRLQTCATSPVDIGDLGKVTASGSIPGVGEAAWTLEVAHRCLAVCAPTATYSVSRVNNVLVFVRQYATTTAGGAPGPDSRAAAQTLARAIARVTG
jgi:hypothetical protein